MRVGMSQDVRLLESVLEHQVFVGEDGQRRTVGHDRPLVHDHGPRAQLGDELQIVGGDDFRGLDRPEQRLQQPLSPGIETPRRFVQGQDPRPAGQEAGQADPLFLSAAQVMGGTPLESRKPDFRQSLPDDALDVPLPRTELPRAERNVLEDRGAEQLVLRVLEKQPDVAPDVRQIGFDHGQAVNPNRRAAPAVLRQDPVQVQEQSRLARAVGPDQAHGLPFGDCQADVAKGDAAVFVGEAEVFHFDGGPGHFHPRADMAA